MIDYYLEKLESNGFEAYVVGGYVRDKLLNITSTDIDIATSAKPEDIKRIFNLKKDSNFGSFQIIDGYLSIDITSFRSEKKYINRHPQKIKFINNLKRDAKRRDFTINAIYLDSKNHYIDPYNGITDLKNKTIRSVENPNKKFKEDPLRILRALRLAIIYEFSIERKTYNAILKNKYLLKYLSYERKKEELNKILLSKRAFEGLVFLNNLGILEILEIKKPSNFQISNDILKSWAQLQFSPNYPFSNKEKKQLEKYKEIYKMRSD